MTLVKLTLLGQLSRAFIWPLNTAIKSAIKDRLSQFELWLA